MVDQDDTSHPFLPEPPSYWHPNLRVDCVSAEELPVPSPSPSVLSLNSGLPRISCQDIVLLLGFVIPFTRRRPASAGRRSIKANILATID
jgi:hypothetical protein